MQAHAGPVDDSTEADPAALLRRIQSDYLADEAPQLLVLAADARLPATASARVVARAAGWVREVRAASNEQSLLDAFMRQYDLSTEEGVVLMCLAEALLRIPDEATAEQLISDKLGGSDWQRHLGRSDSILVNAGTWGLMLSGQLIRLSESADRNVYAALQRMIGRSSEPVIRLAVRHAMRMMGTQFVLGRSIEEALQQAAGPRQRPYLHSFDMLGEAALTAADADRYFDAYQHAIATVATSPLEGTVFQRPSVSIKLSALHPRYEFAKAARVQRELAPRLLQLAVAARRGNIGLTIDAEEADRLELSLQLFEQVFSAPALQDWEGLGLVVQAFQKRAPAVIRWLDALAARTGRRIPLRLVKGAYWDTEIKRSQEQGLVGYPVYTRKSHTDVAYLACARRLLARRERFYPMFATHNAHTISSVLEYAGDTQGYEFQRLHGMGEALYTAVRGGVPVPCRVYAPVGSHEDLLPYLVRRLLENGANTSFVNRIYDESLPPEALVADPVEAVLAAPGEPAIAAPADLFQPQRRNSAGINFASSPDMDTLQQGLRAASAPQRAQAIVSVAVEHEAECPVYSPADRRVAVGRWSPTKPDSVAAVIEAARAAQPDWAQTATDTRCAALERAADLLEARRDEFMQLLCAEAGKTLADGIAEVREAVDFLRYYAALARTQLAPQTLPGPTGEHNELQLHAKGVFVCISPWNFPLAIFTGQVAAALVCGNAVVAKPAEQTNLIAAAVTRLLHEAGVPASVLQLVLGDETVGQALTRHPLPAGVVFTGSSAAARSINRALAQRDGAIATLIAETGGQNAMIVDSSALPEQVVKDAIHSAFGSAGQRCSALRVLYVQNDIADKVLNLLQGAMRELQIGDPSDPATDIGPIIDDEAVRRLQEHRARIAAQGSLVYQCELPAQCADGSYFAPCLAQIGSLAELQEEVFGPFLHVIRYDAEALPQVLEQINASGYGLTLGIHSRINQRWQQIQQTVRAGNCYVNRGMTGAVVGVQPFGGEGLSGTGPKAGGPHYLMRFVTERTLTVNTAAVGGNAQLLNQNQRTHS